MSRVILYISTTHLRFVWCQFNPMASQGYGWDARHIHALLIYTFISSLYSACWSIFNISMTNISYGSMNRSTCEERGHVCVRASKDRENGLSLNNFNPDLTLKDNCVYLWSLFFYDYSSTVLWSRGKMKMLHQQIQCQRKEVSLPVTRKTQFLMIPIFSSGNKKKKKNTVKGISSAAQRSYAAYGGLKIWMNQQLLLNSDLWNHFKSKSYWVCVGLNLHMHIRVCYIFIALVTTVIFFLGPTVK